MKELSIEIKDRIEEFAKFLGLPMYKFEQFCEIGGGIIGKKSGITIRILEKILNAYPNLNKNWLLFGEGNMLLSDENAPKQEIVMIPTDNPQVGIPLIPFEAMAGIARGEITILDYECERYIIPMFKNADFLIAVKGTSMYPKYMSGDIVACKIVPMSDLFFQWNKVYVLDTAQGALIKRIKKGSDKEHILIVSDNKEYEPFELALTQINAVALVVGLIRNE